VRGAAARRRQRRRLRQAEEEGRRAAARPAEVARLPESQHVARVISDTLTPEQ
jgi:hypothetical protein